MSPRSSHTYPRLVLSDRGDAQTDYARGTELAAVVSALLEVAADTSMR